MEAYASALGRWIDADYRLYVENLPPAKSVFPYKSI